VCNAGTRSSSRASSRSSLTSSIAEEDSDASEASDTFVPPRRITTRRTTTTQRQQQRGTDEATWHKPVLKPSTAERRVQYLPKSPKTVSTREPASSTTPGWRTRLHKPDAGVTGQTGVSAADSTGSHAQQSLPTTPVNEGVFKVPKTPPVSSARRRDAGSRIPRTAFGGEGRRADDSTAGRQLQTAAATDTAEPGVARPGTPPPSRLHSSGSDLALSAGSGSSSRTRSRIPTLGGAQHSQRDAEPRSRGSSPSSVK